MRRTGSEEIGFKQSPRPAGITSGVPRVLPLADFFGEAPERRPWIKEHDDAGRTLPGFIFAFVFYWLDLPTDCAIEPSFATLPVSATAPATHTPRPRNFHLRHTLFTHPPSIRHRRRGLALFREILSRKSRERARRLGRVSGSLGLGCCSLNNVKSQAGRLVLEIVDLALTMRRLVDLRSLIDELHTVTQHAIDQPGELGRHGFNCHGSVQPAFQSAKLCP